MGWWDSLWASSSNGDDPLRKLDPKLREFLERESPVKYSATQQQEEEKKRKEESEAAAAAAAEKHRQEERSKSAVPTQSQFQDGRYANLWKTYRPLAEIEAETKSEHEKLMDVLEGYKDRRSQIGKAALENCALEQVDWRECMTNPSFAERMTMCRTQVRKFEKCYMTQTRLLKALGYLSTYDRSPEDEEEIQMHADMLYHRMLEQEAEVAAARQEGRPIPTFPPVITKAPAAAVKQQQQQKQHPEEDLTQEQLETLRARLKKVAEEDRFAEEQAIRAEWRAKAEIASRVEELWKKQDQDRLARKERGEETLWDKVSGAFRNGSQNGSQTR
ncbi:hypothetical protein GGR54DRAFT_599061 [Hypoxylon sp. NC1633]|nr:hypothetical protein GGR54DRAFT_599061 [Hypoxylon sp. NC1633]